MLQPQDSAPLADVRPSDDSSSPPTARPAPRRAALFFLNFREGMAALSQGAHRPGGQSGGRCRTRARPEGGPWTNRRVLTSPSSNFWLAEPAPARSRVAMGCPRRRSSGGARRTSPGSRPGPAPRQRGRGGRSWWWRRRWCSASGSRARRWRGPRRAVRRRSPRPCGPSAPTRRRSPRRSTATPSSSSTGSSRRWARLPRPCASAGARRSTGPSRSMAVSPPPGSGCRTWTRPP